MGYKKHWTYEQPAAVDNVVYLRMRLQMVIDEFALAGVHQTDDAGQIDVSTAVYPPIVAGKYQDIGFLTFQVFAGTFLRINFSYFKMRPSTSEGILATTYSIGDGTDSNGNLTGNVLIMPDGRMARDYYYEIASPATTGAGNVQTFQCAIYKNSEIFWCSIGLNRHFKSGGYKCFYPLVSIILEKRNGITSFFSHYPRIKDSGEETYALQPQVESFSALGDEQNILRQKNNCPMWSSGYGAGGDIYVLRNYSPCVGSRVTNIESMYAIGASMVTHLQEIDLLTNGITPVKYICFKDAGYVPFKPSSNNNWVPLLIWD